MEPLHYLLMRAHTKLNRAILEGASALGLSPGQPKVLEFLLTHGESNQKSIAEYCEIEPATVGSILTWMERDGLITRTQRDGNRRSLYVSLTPHGRNMGQRMAEVFRAADGRAARELSLEDRVALEEVHEHVIHSLEQVEKMREA